MAFTGEVVSVSSCQSQSSCLPVSVMVSNAALTLQIVSLFVALSYVFIVRNIFNFSL